VCGGGDNDSKILSCVRLHITAVIFITETPITRRQCGADISHRCVCVCVCVRALKVDATFFVNRLPGGSQPRLVRFQVERLPPPTWLAVDSSSRPKSAFPVTVLVRVCVCVCVCMSNNILHKYDDLLLFMVECILTVFAIS